MSHDCSESLFFRRSSQSSDSWFSASLVAIRGRAELCKAIMIPPQKRDLCRDARAIWQAGVDAVQPARLLANAMQLRGDVLTVVGREYRISELGRIAVVGA